MSHTRRTLSLLVGAALLAALSATTALAEASGIKKVTQQADKAITNGVREAGKGFKQASQAVDRAAKAGSDAVRRAAKGRE